MSSRAEQRAAARAEREAREQAADAGERRKRRIYMLGGALVVAVVVVGIAIAVSQGGGGGSKSKGGSIGNAAAVTTQLAGIPQSGTTLGNSSAPVTITEFADLQCPVCQEFNGSALKQLIANEV